MPTGNFGDIYAGYVAERLGLPIDRLVVATNVNDILVRVRSERQLRIARCRATSSPSWTSRSRRISSACCSTPRPRRRGGARADRIADAVATLFRGGAGAYNHFGTVRRGPSQEEEVSATLRTVRRETGNLGDPAHCRGHRRRRKGAARSGRADGRAVHGASGEISRRGRGGDRRAPGSTHMAFGSHSAAAAHDCAAGRSSAVEQFVLSTAVPHRKER